MIGGPEFTALGITVALAAVTVVLLFAIGLPLAWWLARGRGTVRALVATAVALPLVLPPTVLGFYLLLLLGERGPLAAVGLPTLAFSFPGLVIGSMVYSLPFVVQPLADGFRAVEERTLDAAATIGASPWDRFWSVAVPESRHALITAAVLGFAHTMGEFGVVLMIGGSIPGETRVASIAIFEHVEGLRYGSAHALAAVLLLLSCCLLLPLHLLGRRAKVMP